MLTAMITSMEQIEESISKFEQKFVEEKNKFGEKTVGERVNNETKTYDFNIHAISEEIHRTIEKLDSLMFDKESAERFRKKNIIRGLQEVIEKIDEERQRISNFKVGVIQN